MKAPRRSNVSSRFRRGRVTGRGHASLQDDDQTPRSDRVAGNQPKLPHPVWGIFEPRNAVITNPSSQRELPGRGSDAIKDRRLRALPSETEALQTSSDTSNLPCSGWCRKGRTAERARPFGEIAFKEFGGRSGTASAG